MSAPPTPYQSPPAPMPDELPPLTPADQQRARDIWELLHRAKSPDETLLDTAPDIVRAHIFEQSRLSLIGGDEPDASNPFE